MAKWTNAVITNLGKILENKVLSGEKIEITKVTAGEGSVKLIDLRNQTSLVNEKQTLSITDLKLDNDNTTVNVLLTVSDLEESYNLQQIGFYANDPDNGEILFAIAQADSSTVLPTKYEMPMYSINFYFHFSIVNDGGMTVTVDKAAFVTNEQLENERKVRSEADELLEYNLALEVERAKIAEKDNADNFALHSENNSNPHGVTKEQVGLGNVPNVSTNDQTPTYTVASSNTDLSSGEKLSIAMGKIAKAVSSLISHLLNKSNPHGVTKEQVGLGNVENKSSETIRGELTKENVTSALGYTPPTSDTNTWRPLGTGANDACAGNDSRLSNARPASDVYSWAKASTKPSYSYSEVGAAAASHSHNYAGSSSAGGAATNAVGVLDYANTSQTIKIGFAGAGATTSNLAYIAGYLSGGTQIKDVSKDTLKSWLGLGSAAYTNSSAYATASHSHDYIPASASCNKNWSWSGQSGQPSWLWGSNDGSNMYVWNPSNFSVNYANSAGTANSASYASSAGGVNWDNVSNKPGIIYASGNQSISGSLTLSGGVFSPYIQIYGSGNFSVYSPALQCRNSNNTAWVPCYASSYPSQSSKLIKKNVESMTDEEALKLLNLHVVTFDYKNEENGTDCRGLIAEETIDIIPSCVTVPEDYATTEEELNDNQTNALGIDYSKLVPYLIKMVQIQQKEINELKKMIK